ncbi:MAG: DUF61 family protein [Candidatus Ranarchaeia archaeon]
MGKWEAYLNNIENEIQKLNEHLPKNNTTLFDLINNQAPKIKTRSEEDWHFNREEIKSVSKLVPEKYWDKITLPIILLRRQDLGLGAFTISGNKINEFLISKILNGKEANFEELLESKKPLIIYKPQVRDVRRILKTLTTISFGVSTK